MNCVSACPSQVANISTLGALTISGITPPNSNSPLNTFAIVDADGYPLTGPAEQGGEQILLATLNLAEARNKRISDA